MILFQATNQQSVEGWHTENDVVMGGVSSSQVTFASDEGAARFSGDVSLENGGGFAQILYNIPDVDLTGFEGVELHIKGDAQTYQVRLEKDSEKPAYAQSFVAENDWQRIRLAFADFGATYHGEDVPDAAPLDLAALQTVGLLIGDGQEGEFELLIRELKAY